MVIQKYCEVYRACRDVVRVEKDAPDKALYHKQYQAEYQLHDVTLKELASAKKEKQDLQKRQKTLQVIEHNFDAMIRKAGMKVPEKEPSQKKQEDMCYLFYPILVSYIDMSRTKYEPK